MSRRFRSRTAGFSFNTTRAGNSSASALVCVHGFRGNAHAFDGLARRFRDRYHVLSLDVRGRGDSEDHIERRLEVGKQEELAGREIADAVVINDDVDGAARRVAGILQRYR